LEERLSVLQQAFGAEVHQICQKRHHARLFRYHQKLIAVDSALEEIDMPELFEAVVENSCHLNTGGVVT